jgi:hypothetical protein
VRDRTLTKTKGMPKLMKHGEANMRVGVAARA